MDIPLIDLAPFLSGEASASVAAQWDGAMREYGFALVRGHGIGENLLDGVYGQAQAFFARPIAEKMKVCHGDMKRGQGYLPLLNETVGRARDPAARPDLCESLSFCATPGARENLWPDGTGFRAAVEAYIAAANGLAGDLMRLSAEALALPPDYFAPFYTHMNSDLRCVLYPDQETPPEEGQLRYGPHTDFGGFTILRQDDAPGGLQVKWQDAWIDVPAISGTLVINAGDLIQRWTNDVWLSNIHRVVNPDPLRPSHAPGRATATSPFHASHKGEAGQNTRRLSVVLFTSPNSEALIETLPTCGPARHAPIVAGAHVEERIAATYGNLAP